VPDDSAASPSFLSRFVRAPKKASAVPREVVMGLDKLERGVSFFGGAIALVLSAVTVPRILKNTYYQETAKYSTTKPHCPANYKHVASLCSRLLLTHPSYWIPSFIATLTFGLFILWFAFSRKRAGVAFCAFLLGLMISAFDGLASGIIFYFLGGWLVIRALRLQRYGDATFAGSSRRAREVNKAKREGRTLEAPTTNDKSSTKIVAPLPKLPEESKRYTPKKPPRKKR
jgi:hypothetical protein